MDSQPTPDTIKIQEMIDFSKHPLVETTWLARHLSDDDVCIVDARWRGDGSSSDLYRHGHIPGAIHLDWYQDLSWTDARGVRNLLLPSEQFVKVMEAVGIGDRTYVVAYAESNEQVSDNDERAVFIVRQPFTHFLSFKSYQEAYI